MPTYCNVQFLLLLLFLLLLALRLLLRPLASVLLLLPLKKLAPMMTTMAPVTWPKL